MKKNNLIYKIINNHEFRGYFLSILSLITSIFFLTYNFYIGLKYKLIWNTSITFYYLILLIIRLIILINEKKWLLLNKDQLKNNRIKLLKIINTLFIFIDIVLIVPIILMVLGEKNINIGMIPAIAIAAYTTYKIIISIINFNKTKQSENLMLHVLKTINLKEAIVSIITLQNILIMTFSNGKSMTQLTAFTSAGLLLLLICVSLYQIIKERKMKIFSE